MQKRRAPRGMTVRKVKTPALNLSGIIPGLGSGGIKRRVTGAKAFVTHCCLTTDVHGPASRSCRQDHPNLRACTLFLRLFLPGLCHSMRTAAHPAMMKRVHSCSFHGSSPAWVACLGSGTEAGHRVIEGTPKVLVSSGMVQRWILIMNAPSPSPSS